MDNKRLHKLLIEYFDNTISPENCEELLNALDNHENSTIAEAIDSALSEYHTGPELSGAQADSILAKIKMDSRFSNVPHSNKLRNNLTRQFQSSWLRAAAALIIFILSFVTYSYFKKGERNNHSQFAANKINRPENGTENVVLKLANGKSIYLNKTNHGLVAKLNGTLVKKTQNDVLIFNGSSLDKSHSAKYTQNTLSTPKGKEYQVLLADGTKVWLNAASTFSFPTDFPGAERVVTLTGEAYFEVARNEKKPFKVLANGTTIQVLGTHFNVSAYPDDDITTTLLKGSVRIVNNKFNSLLAPGQQAIVKPNVDGINISSANIKQNMAWRRGYFIFDNESIKSIMQKISRWYDVDVEFDGPINNHQYGGTFYRSKDLTELLKHLEELGNVHFKVNGRRVIVMK